MTSLEVLEERRDLVLRSVKLQRATIAVRLNRIEGRPGMTLFESTLHFLGKAWGRRAAVVTLGIVLKSIQRSAALARAGGQGR